MALDTSIIRELIGQTGGMSEGALQHIIDAETARATQYAPYAPDDALRDSVIIELIKITLAYQGYSSSSIQGFSATVAALPESRYHALLPLFPYSLEPLEDDTD